MLTSARRLQPRLAMRHAVTLVSLMLACATKPHSSQTHETAVLPAPDLPAVRSTTSGTSDPPAPPPENADICSGLVESSYFRPGTFFPERRASELDATLRRWYSTVLLALHQPNLACGGTEGQAYRFLSIPSWGPPTVILVNLAPGRASVSVASLDHAGDRGPATLSLAAGRLLFKAERELISDVIDHSGFWTAIPAKPEVFGPEGTHWVLEGRSRLGHRAVQRWVPMQGPLCGRDACTDRSCAEVATICRTLARFAGIPSG